MTHNRGERRELDRTNLRSTWGLAARVPMAHPARVRRVPQFRDAASKLLGYVLARYHYV